MPMFTHGIHAAPAPAFSLSPPRPPHAPILVVDDDQDLRETLVMVLDIEGYWVTHVATTAEALVYLRVAPREFVVLLGFMRLGGNADHLLHAVECEATLQRHGYVLMLGSPLTHFTQEAQRLITAYYMAVLYKPFDRERLLGVVERAAAHLANAG